MCGRSERYSNRKRRQQKEILINRISLKLYFYLFSFSRKDLNGNRKFKQKDFIINHIYGSNNIQREIIKKYCQMLENIILYCGEDNWDRKF